MKAMFTLIWHLLPINIRWALVLACRKLPFYGYLSRIKRLICNPVFDSHMHIRSDNSYAFWDAIQALSLLSIILFAFKYGIFYPLNFDVLAFVNPLFFSGFVLFQGLVFCLVFSACCHMIFRAVYIFSTSERLPIFSKSFLHCFRGFSVFMILFCMLGLLMFKRYLTHCDISIPINTSEMWISGILAVLLMFVSLRIFCRPVYLELSHTIHRWLALFISFTIFGIAFSVYVEIRPDSMAHLILDTEALQASLGDSLCIRDLLK